jgi:outer membrane protein TolC
MKILIKSFFALLGCTFMMSCEQSITFDDDLEAAAARLEVEIESPNMGKEQSGVVSVNADLIDFARSALRASPIVTNARFQLEAARQQLKEERSQFQPLLGLTVEESNTNQALLESSNPSFAGNQSSYPTRDANLRLSQTLFDVPASANIARANAVIEARTSELTSAEQRVLNTILVRHLQAAEALERVILAEAETEYFQKANAAETRRVDEGDMRPSTRSATVSELARARSDLAIARADYAIRVKSFCRLSETGVCPLPRQVSLNLVLPRPTPLDEEELAALESSPDFQVLDANLKAALREVDRARTRNWPVLSAYVEAAQRDRGGSLFDGSSLTETVNVGVVFDWQIFQGGGVDAAARREINEAMALDAERRQVLQERTGELEAAATGLEALWQNDIALQTVMAARLRALRDAEREQSEGASSELELALAKLELTRAEVLRRAARRTFLAATIAREWSIGQLDMKMIDLIGKLAGRTDEAEQTYRMKRLP